MTGLARRGRWQLRKARRAVLDRSGGACEARIARAACTGRADHAHHVLPRSAGGDDSPDEQHDDCDVPHREPLSIGVAADIALP